MCRHDNEAAARLLALQPAATDTATPAVAARLPERAVITGPAPGSRRRRVWELDNHAHCPVIGVCLPIPLLRRLVDKVIGGKATTVDDYELHCRVIAECRNRTPLAEAVQKELERRYALVVQRAAALKATEALAGWWDQASAGSDLAGTFWATLTHPRCTPELARRVLGEVHMLQHQVGMNSRVDQAKLDAVVDENAVLARQLAGAQERSTRQAADFARRIEQLESELMRTRAQLIGSRTELAELRGQMAALQPSRPEPPPRMDAARERGRQIERIVQMQRAHWQARQEAERQRRRADEACAALEALRRAEADTASSGETAPGAVPAALVDRAVLCVGGRAASVPAYRQLIERTGGRFLHHDGGEEESAARLDATLAAADLVICQTGCISHDAYWRVKDHCKRTGKRCVFVETPSRSALERALGEVCGDGPPGPLQTGTGRSAG